MVRCRSGDAAAGVQPRYSRSRTAGCTSVGLRLFLHSQLSFGYCHGQLRPLRNDRYRQVPAQPLVHDAGSRLRDRFHSRGVRSVADFLLRQTSK